MKDSRFTRSCYHVGRGIQLYKSKNIAIRGNTVKGYYMTAINITGQANQHPSLIKDRSAFIEVKNNHFQRIPHSHPYVEDHGIYAWGFYKLTVNSNYFEGWSRSTCGYALKIRNGQFAEIHHNSIRDSGIALYTYHQNLPKWLQYISIKNNKIGVGATRRDFSIANGCTHSTPAVFYWKNFNSTSTIEKQIEISGNRINGEVKIYQPANLSEFYINNLSN